VGGFDDAGLEGVLDLAGEDVEPGTLLTVVVCGPEVDERVDRIEAGVLREHAGHEFEGVGEGFYCQLLAALDAVGVPAKPTGEFDLDRAAAGEYATVGDRLGDHVERVGDSPFELVDHVVGRTPEQEGHAVGLLALAFDVEQLVGVVPANRAVPEIVFARRIEIRNDPRAEDLAQELHVGFLRPAHGQDTLLREEVLGEVVDALLTEHYIGAGVFDPLDLLAQLAVLLVEEVLELVGARQRDLGTSFCLFDLDGLAQQHDGGVLDVGWHIVVYRVLRDHRAVE